MGLYHFIGWPNCHDEWRELDSLVTICHCPEMDCPVTEQFKNFKYKFIFEIKKSLHVSSDTDPSVNIPMDVELNLFQSVFGTRKDSLKILDNEELSEILEADWWWRINSAKLDFAYIIQGTLTMSVRPRRTVTEFKMNADGTHRELRRSGPHTLHISFVRGQGPEHMFQHGDWKQLPQTVN